MEILRYFFLTHFSATANIVIIGAALWLTFSALRLHYLLSEIVKKQDLKQRRRTLYRPMCIQGTRAVAAYGLVYSIMSLRWVCCEQYMSIGAGDDFIWLCIEGLGFYAMFKWMAVARMILYKSLERRTVDD